MIYLILVLVVLGVLVVGLYNSVIKLKNKVEEAWSDIDTQLKRRYDLIPNLVETVKGYAAHESSTFEKVTQARTAAMNAQSVQEKEAAENMLSGALKTIFALAENYPELKANENFMHLQQTLKEIEEHLQMARRYYNGTVKDFNTKIQIFPNNLIAKLFGFKDREFFQATDEEKKNVKVSFKEQNETPTPTQAVPTPAPEQPAPPAAPQAPTPTPAQPETTAPQEPKPAEPEESTPAPTPTPEQQPTEPAAPAETPAAPEQQATPQPETPEEPKQ